MTRVVVLSSGTGTVMQALLDAPVAASIVAVGSDKPGIGALARAEKAGIPTFVVPFADYPERTEWDAALRTALGAHRPDLIVLAGFMRLLGPDIVAAYRDRIINTHPALLPSFPGAHGVRDALAYGVKVTGCSVIVVDDGIDTGRILAQEAVPVLADDDESSLHERIKVVERRLLVSVVTELVDKSASPAPSNTT